MNDAIENNKNMKQKDWKKSITNANLMSIRRRWNDKNLEAKEIKRRKRERMRRWKVQKKTIKKIKMVNNKQDKFEKRDRERK